MPSPVAEPEQQSIPLRDPAFAALLAWLWPGAGHLYQGRTVKGAVFMVCILSTFVTGFLLGDGRVVYASWKPDEFRWMYLCQAWSGAPALPALVEGIRYRRNRADYRPLFGESRWYAPPLPAVFRGGDPESELDRLNYRLGRDFEFGTIYTAVAGLLNILVIYDAWAGPAFARKKEDDESQPADADKDKAAKTETANA